MANNNKIITLNDLQIKWDFNALHWSKTLFPNSNYGKDEDTPKIMVILRQGKQSGEYDYYNTPYYNSTTEIRTAKLCNAILNRSSYVSISREAREAVLRNISWINIAPPIKGNVESNWNDLKAYLKKDDFKRTRECIDSIIKLNPDIVIFSGTFGAFYDFFAYVNEKPDNITKMLSGAVSTYSKKCGFYLPVNNSSRLFVEIPHISSSTVEYDDGKKKKSIESVLPDISGGCIEWLQIKLFIKENREKLLRLSDSGDEYDLIDFLEEMKTNG